MRFEEKYLDVLQNIEFSILSTYREYPKISDYSVMNMLEVLINIYTSEEMGRSPRQSSLSDLEEILLENVKDICEWRLGRISMDKEIPEITSIEEIILCLKRILKSVKKFNKNGDRGYITFIIQFVK